MRIVLNYLIGLDDVVRVTIDAAKHRVEIECQGKIAESSRTFLAERALDGDGFDLELYGQHVQAGVAYADLSPTRVVAIFRLG